MNIATRLTILGLAIIGLANTTSGFYTKVRSIKHCTAIESPSDKNCNRLCESQLPQGWESPLNTKFTAELKPSNEGQQCCCKFDDSWPIDKEDDWYSGKNDVGDLVIKKQLLGEVHQCSKVRLPLIKNDELAAYKTMCKYLEIKRPLTMLELANLIKSVSFLKSINPKRSTIREELAKNYVPNFSTEHKDLFERKLDLLLDHKRHHISPGFPPYEVDEIRKLQELTSELRQTMDIDIVHRSLDELLISRVIMSIIEADLTFNVRLRTIPYDRFLYLDDDDDDDDPNEVLYNGVSCKDFISVRDALVNLLETARSALGSLRTPSVFDEMNKQHNWVAMYNLEKSIETYTNLINEHCAIQGGAN